MGWCVVGQTLHVVCVISMFMANPGKSHWESLKWTMKYLKGSTKLGLKFLKQADTSCPVVGVVDSDFAGNLDTMKSLSGFVFTTLRTTIYWKEMLQPVVALSTSKAEL